jgi:hypothetical protein
MNRIKGIRTSGEEHPFRVDRQRVDDRVVSSEIENEGTLGRLPLLDVVPPRRTSSKGILCWVDGDRAY